MKLKILATGLALALLTTGAHAEDTCYDAAGLVNGGPKLKVIPCPSTTVPNDLPTSAYPADACKYEVLGSTRDSLTIRINVGPKTCGVKLGDSDRTLQISPNGVTGREFIRDTYRVLLGREPDNQGLRDWGSWLGDYNKDLSTKQDAVTAFAIFEGIIKSPEFRTRK